MPLGNGEGNFGGDPSQTELLDAVLAAFGAVGTSERSPLLETPDRTLRADPAVGRLLDYMSKHKTHTSA